MAYLNWLDILLLLLLFVFLMRGISIGLIGSVFEVLSILAGMLVASRYYSLAGNYFMERFQISNSLVDTISFAVIFIIVSALITVVGSLVSLVTRLPFIRKLDRVGGSFTGAVVGMVAVGMILVLLTTFPLIEDFNSRVKESQLASSMLNLMEGLYEKSTDILPVDFPRLAFYPEYLTDFSRQGPAFKAINFKDLEGAICINCGGKVEFEGYLSTNENSISPKFICPDCSRSSDGCQTFEGYHIMYEGCPIVLGRQGYRFDCGVWTNGNFVRPTGECPVCGEKSTAGDSSRKEKHILLP